MPRVKTVRRAGRMQCYDILNVRGTMCYALANKVVSHNSVALDEVNFMRTTQDDGGKLIGQAYELYNATTSRMRSRFMRPGGETPGISLLMSSRNATTSFMEQHLKTVTNGKYREGMRGFVAPGIFLTDYALYEVKSESYSKKTFAVQVGDRLQRSRIIRDGETPRPGAKIIRVPVDFITTFERDTDKGLREIAGVATLNTSPLVSDLQSVHDAYKGAEWGSPFTSDELRIGVGDPTLIQDYFDEKRAFRVVNSIWQPRRDPERYRFIHGDLSLGGDAMGLACVHPVGTVKQYRERDSGHKVEVVRGLYEVDWMIRIRATPGAQIDLTKVGSFILYLSKLYPLRLVSFDGFQSAYLIQLLRNQGVESKVISVDRTDEPYLLLRDTLFERRIATYEYLPFINEMIDLQRDLTKRRVDHPEHATTGGPGSKDVADAVCGAVWTCTADPRAYSPVTPGRMDDAESKSDPVVLETESADNLTARRTKVPVHKAGGLSWSALEKNLK